MFHVINNKWQTVLPLHGIPLIELLFIIRFMSTHYQMTMGSSRVSYIEGSGVRKCHKHVADICQFMTRSTGSLMITCCNPWNITLQLSKNQKKDKQQIDKNNNIDKRWSCQITKIFMWLNFNTISGTFDIHNQISNLWRQTLSIVWTLEPLYLHDRGLWQSQWKLNMPKLIRFDTCHFIINDNKQSRITHFYYLPLKSSLIKGWRRTWKKR